MTGQMAHDEVHVLVYRPQPLLGEPFPLATFEERRARAADEAVRELPVDEPDAELEGAAPVGAERIRALPYPTRDQPTQMIEIAAVAGQSVRLRERDDLEVAIELPEILDVPDDARVPIVQRLAERERRLGTSLGIDVPTHLVPEHEALAEKVEPAADDAVGCRDVVLRVAHRRHRLRRFRGRRPCARRRRAIRAQRSEPLQREARLPRAARRDLARGHRPQATQIP